MSSKPISKILSSSDGTKIYGDAVGNPLKPHLVFVHGISLSAGVFDKIFVNPIFQERYYLVRYDMRGHGRSGKPNSKEGYVSKLYADDYAVVAKEFSLSRPIFVGWSLGGTVAADIAAYLPRDTLRGIVYLNGCFNMIDASALSTPLSPATLSVLMDEGASPEAVRLATLGFTDGIFDPKSDLDSGSEADLEKRRIARWEAQSAWIGYITHQSVAVRRLIGSREQDSSALNALGAAGDFPFLVVQGSQDALLDAQAAVSKAKELFKNVKIIEIEKAGHAPFEDNPEEVMAYIGDFVVDIESK